MIFHICPVSHWVTAIQEGIYTPPGLAEEGFIHCSVLSQLTDTANRHFRNQKELVVLCIREEQLDVPVKYEVAPGRGEAFPHVYGPVNLSAVVNVIDLEEENGHFIVPEELVYQQ